jgi:ABC-type transport system involved in multi-copper enzyme maturation permease subunit
MLSFYNITSIARYERRILMRSWFFRIFALLSLFIIGMFSGVTLFNRDSFSWAFRSLPSAMIYSNMFLLNVFQSVIAIFLATDFLKRDKKLNTSEVMFIRPMSNSDYVLGKTTGLLTVFALLNLLVIILTSVFILISNQVPFRVAPLLIYLVLISLPTLVFITGLSFALMTIVKNQSITFILLLGYIGLILFYLGDKTGYLYDYLAFKLPMAYSDVIGFSDIQAILLQRMSYLVLGIGLILFTIWRLNRLPNTSSSNWGIAVLMTLLLVTASLGFSKLYLNNHDLKQDREIYSQLCADYYERPVAQMKTASITFEYAKQVKAHSKMTMVNKNEQVIDTLFFSLNPGFHVEKVTSATTELKFIQNRLLIAVVPTKSLKPNDELVLTIYYSGIPDFNISYLDIDYEDVYGSTSVNTMRFDRQYGFYSDDYVLLTKENLWYPVSGIAYDPTRPAIFQQQFTLFDLEVISKPGMLPISQGIATTTDSISYQFKVEDPLPQLSLNIGNYVQRSVDINGIKVGVAFFEGHNKFDKQLSELKDTLNDLIVEFIDDYERPLGLYYPYPVFTVVEVPVQFASQPHSWTSALAQSQPQMVYFPEWGFNVRQADLKTSYQRIKENSDRNKEGLEEVEIQAKVFVDFLKGVFSAQNADVSFRQMENAGSNPYNIFPNYFYYVNYITSDECPVLNYAFESYLIQGDVDPRQMFMSSMIGIGDDEKANLLLQKKSLKQIISEEEDQQAVNRVLKAKGAYLLTWMEKQINNEGFNEFLLDYLYDNRFCEIKYNTLNKELASTFNVKLDHFISDWYTASKLPSFDMSGYEVYEVIDESQAVYLVKTKVTNYSDVAGLVEFISMAGGGGGQRGGGGGGGASESEERVFRIDGGQTKEIQMIFSSSPRMIIFNTLLSKNIPTKSMTGGLKAENKPDMPAEEYDRVIDDPVVLIEEGELIVDNSDRGFSVYDPSLENPIRKYFADRNKQQEEFVGQGFGSAPSTWSLSANSDYFGKIEHSARIVRSGEGNKVATWKKELPEAGYYDVYTYLSEQRSFGRHRDQSKPTGKYVYTITHDDGVENVEIEVQNFENGWNLLGSFYFQADTTSVSLSDEGGAKTVIADAIKWVKQK